MEFRTLSTSDGKLEALTFAYGQEIFARLERQGPSLFTPGWWDERLMEWTMADEAVKLQLFRFIDVLPLLNSPADITRHLREYFAEAGSSLPGWVQFAMRWLPRDGWLAGLVAKMARGNARRLARRFIAGSNVAEVLA